MLLIQRHCTKVLRGNFYFYFVKVINVRLSIYHEHDKRDVVCHALG